MNEPYLDARMYFVCLTKVYAKGTPGPILKDLIPADEEKGAGIKPPFIYENDLKMVP